jgi:hypothetical protein
MKKNSINLPDIADKAVLKIENYFIAIIKELNLKLIEILRDRNRYEIEIVDVGYDVSEHVHSTGESFNIENYENVKDFLEEPTGNTIPTYVSGTGLMAETYEDYFRDLIMRKKYDIAEQVFRKELNIGNKMSEEEKVLFDDFNDIFCDVSIEIEQNIYEVFSNQKIYSILKFYNYEN